MRGRFSHAEATRIARAARGYAALARADRRAAAALTFAGDAPATGAVHLLCPTPFGAALAEWFRRHGAGEPSTREFAPPSLGGAVPPPSEIPPGAVLLHLRRTGLTAFHARVAPLPAGPLGTALDDMFMDNPAQYRW